MSRSRPLQVRLVQLGYGDDEPVADRIARVAGLVRAQRGADLVMLPELWSHGGFASRHWPQRAESLAESLAESPAGSPAGTGADTAVTAATVTAIRAAARDAGVAVHAGSLVEREPGPGSRLWNTSVLLDAAGAVVATYRKLHRFGFGAGEAQLLSSGDRVVTAELPLPGGGPPLRVGLATCYDLRFPELFRRLLDGGARVFLVPAAWPQARIEHWSVLGRARAIENQCALLGCNTAGEHSGVRMGGRSQLVSAGGEVLAEAGEGEEVLVTELDPAAVDRCRAEFPVLADRRW